MVRPPKKLQVIHGQLRQEILAGDWAVGVKLPSETEIAGRFECSLGTVSKALALLVHEGLVERRARVGTVVISNALESQSSHTQLDAFAFIYPSEQHEGIWRTVKGFQDAAHEASRRVVMLTTGLDYRRETEFLLRLSEFDVRGAVVYPIIPSPEEQVHFSQMLVNSKFPVILTELNLPGLGCSSVVVDGFHAGYTMTKHLIAQGMKSIGYFSNFAWAPFMRDRYLGYRWALEESGIPERKESVLLESSMRADFKNPFRDVTELARVYLQKNKDLEGVVCANDFLAGGLIDAAHQEGLRIPEDLKVTGIDDYASYSSNQAASLTTYRIPYEEMGRKAFEALSSIVQIKGGEVTETQIRGEIVVRATG